jgi:hypothetical protein
MKTLMQHTKEISDFLGIRLPPVRVVLWSEKLYSDYEHPGVYIISAPHKENPYYIGRSYKNIKGRLLSHQQKMYTETREYKQKVYVPAGWKWLVTEEFPNTPERLLKLMELYVFDMTKFEKPAINAFESNLIFRLNPLANDEIFEVTESDSN